MPVERRNRAAKSGAGSFTRADGGVFDPFWYRDAIIYQLHVKAFFDSNNDGIGDLPGLIEKLDYLQELGVTALWLLPFYPSPLRDDGYDIADYTNVHPSYGTLADFRNFVREAHRRGLRVITELVINHTSDQHPWFQAARRAPAGSKKRNFFVWSDTNARYAGTRIIFIDSEVSNWAYDELAGAYYWHRFFSHQPDLNFDNPSVRKAVIRAMRFWLEAGVDGLRLDAIPYLCEREGTNNENLPETHAVVKEIRAVIDAHYRDRMLLGEANQWPEDVRDYFGDGDECHMAFHFPLMPRMYMAIAQEDRHPIVEIMQQTPDIPESCQWAIFLRNHDELTLEMVTSKERDYMYQMYAADPRARANLGIRRRLAPLMDNDVERIKLMNALLLSMPGSPIIYYGDELGMGDNVYLGDRNGVRTPMQWSPDRNGGFSRADPQRLFLPPIMDPVYGYEAVNVEAQIRDSSSLLNWTRRLLAVRKSYIAFGRGSLVFLRPGNRKILAYLREYDGQSLLCVANLARTAQPVELDLSAYKDRVPIEMLGRTVFPPIGELPYLVTLPGHGFYWFHLAAGADAPAWHEGWLAREESPVLVFFDGWRSLFRDRVVPWRIAMAEKLRAQLENEALPRFVAAQRWYAAKGEGVRRVALSDQAEWNEAHGNWLLTVCRIESGAGSALYFLPLALAWESEDRHDETHGDGGRTFPPVPVARIRQQARLGVLADAAADEQFVRAMVAAIGASQEFACAHGRIRCTPTADFDRLVDGRDPLTLPVHASPLASSNSSVNIGLTLFFKAYRRLQAGISPEIEIGRFLTEKVHFPNCVPIAGIVEYLPNDGPVMALAMLQGYVENQGDGWGYTQDYLGRLFENRTTVGAAPTNGDEHAAYRALMTTLGQRTAELHLALATPTGNPAFDPEPLVAADLVALRRQIDDEAATTLEQLERQLDQLPAVVRTAGASLLASRPALLRLIDETMPSSLSMLKTRYHGDFHLGQVLLAQNDFIIIDFEGEPARDLEDRRRKHSPLRDVAGMLRSFHYAARAALAGAGRDPSKDAEALEAAVLAWQQAAESAFLDSYVDRVTQQAPALHGDWSKARRLLDLFRLEKALYELRYELAHRPDWVQVPLHGLLAAIDGGASRSSG
ncbi:MAG: maltose alpha-D-glucosyltransferase [Bacteroidota bacterium]